MMAVRAAYYNEKDAFAAAWLRELIKAGLIAPGEVDERDIWDVVPTDLAGFTQCHFFAGIGVWSYALRLAGWPDDRPVWTGSCPCQPFSAAGAGKGFADKRHLWPALFHLVRVCRPYVIFGEQVSSKLGLVWLDLVYADLESEGYACGALDSCAAGIGAPHIRQRLYWLAHALPSGRCPSCHAGRPDRMGNALCTGLEGYARNDADTQGWPYTSGSTTTASVSPGRERALPPDGYWRAADWLRCRDGKWRPLEPGLEPLAHGPAARVGRLRGYGNALCAPQAAAFIRAYLEAETCPGAAE